MTKREHRSRKVRAAVENLEGRQLLSGLPHMAGGLMASLRRIPVVDARSIQDLRGRIVGSPIAVHRNAPGRLPAPRTPARPAPRPIPTPTPRPTPTPVPTPTAGSTNPAAVSAIMGALGGGIGGEWATLIRREVRSPLAVVRQFTSGGASTFSAPGITFRTPAEQPSFTGRPYDQLLPTAAGGAVFRNNVVEFAAVLRGEFRDPETSYYVFAVDRGAGTSLGPAFAARPGITPDALVTVAVGPFGSSPSGTVRDLTDGGVQSIDPSNIVVQGATLRVFLDASQLPSRGATLNRYRFAMWTQTRPGADPADVASFAPDGSMIPLAVLGDVSVRR